MRAVKQGAICAFTPEQSDILVRPGPRMAEGANHRPVSAASGGEAGQEPMKACISSHHRRGQRGLAAAWLLLWLTLAAALLALLGAGIGSTGSRACSCPP
jgi:hypothetical protein